MAFDMYELAMAYGQGPVPQDCSRKTIYFRAHLEQLMGMLRRAGLVRGIRGAEVAMSDCTGSHPGGDA